MIIYDAYVDATLGNDTNPGTSELPFATLDRLSQEAALVPQGGFRRYLIRAGTYTGGQSFFVERGGEFEITCEPGVTMTCESDLVEGPRGFDIRGTSKLTLYGNGLLIEDYNGLNGGSYANAISGNDFGQLYIYDVTIVDAGDGISLHDACFGHFERLTISECRKSAFSHVGPCSAVHVDCSFTGRADAGGGIGSQGLDTIQSQFLRCTFTPGVNVQSVIFTNAQIRDCVIGTTSFCVTLAAYDSQIEDSYVHARAQSEALSGTTLHRCYGHPAIVHRAGGTGVNIENCVFARNLVSGLQPSIFYAAADPGSGSPLTVRNTALVGFGMVFGLAFTATTAAQATAAGLTLENLAFFNNTVTYDPDLMADPGFVPAANVVTDDPLLGPCNSTVKADWGFLLGSPLTGAAGGGTDIGFPGYDPTRISKSNKAPRYGTSRLEAFTTAVNMTPSDDPDDNLPLPVRGFMVETAGLATVVFENGSEAVVACQPGRVYEFAIVRVKDTGTGNVGVITGGY